MNTTTITIKCNNGHTIVVDLEEEHPVFEIVETEERQMGVEKCHEASITANCDVCKEEIAITLNVWEYPEGAFNHQEISVDKGEVIDECELWPLVSRN